jgi:hypothetical protein
MRDARSQLLRRLALLLSLTTACGCASGPPRRAQSPADLPRLAGKRVALDAVALKPEVTGSGETWCLTLQHPDVALLYSVDFDGTTIRTHYPSGPPPPEGRRVTVTGTLSERTVNQRDGEPRRIYGIQDASWRPIAAPSSTLPPAPGRE